MRRSSAKGIVTCCGVEQLEGCDQWQVVDPYDVTTGARLQHSNNDQSSLGDDEVTERKRKLQTNPPRIKKKKK